MRFITPALTTILKLAFEWDMKLYNPIYEWPS